MCLSIGGNGGHSIGSIHDLDHHFNAIGADDDVVRTTSPKITSWAVEPTQGAGLKAILDQSGLKPA
jgi:hypothetical protein